MSQSQPNNRFLSLLIYPGASGSKPKPFRILLCLKRLNEIRETMETIPVDTLPSDARIRNPKAELLIKVWTRYQNMLSILQHGHILANTKIQNLCPGERGGV